MRRHLSGVRAVFITVCICASLVITALSPAAAQAASSTSTSSGLTGLASLLCPTTGTVQSTVTAPLGSALGGLGLGSVGTKLTSATSTASSAVCNLGVLQVDYHTVYVNSGGQTVTHDTTSLVGVPTALNVDNGLLPDMSADISLTGNSLNTVQLQISRDSDSGTLPVEVEAVISDPAGAVDGRDSIAVGYDATADNAPASFTLSTPLSALTDSSSSYQFTLAQTDPGKTIAVVGSLFDGTLSAPSDLDSFRLDYGASPTTASITAGTGSDISATLDQNTTGPATLSAETTSAMGSTENLNVAIDNLPGTLTLGVNAASGAISWNASAAVNQVTATASSSAPIAFGANDLQATLSNLPTSFTLTAQQSASGLSLTSTNPIGEVDVDAASTGQAYPTVPAGQGGVTLNTTQGVALAVRLYGLTSLAYTTNPVSLSTQMAGGHVFGVNADLAQTGSDGSNSSPLTANLTITDLPASLALSLDPSSGAVSYSASSAVDSITGAIDGSQSIFLGADHLQFALDQVPTSFNLAASQSSDGVDLSSDNPIGEVQLFARSDGESYPTFTADQTGVDIDNTNGLSLGLQVFGLQKLDFSSSPISVSTEMAPGYPFTVNANLAETDSSGNAESPLTANLTFTNMPATLSLAVNPGSGEIDYSASDTVDSLTGSISSPQPILLGATSLSLNLQSVPTKVSIGTANGLDLEAPGGIGSVQLFAASANQQYPSIPGGDAGAYIDNTNGLQLGLQAYGLKQLTYTASPLSLTTQMDPGHAFSVAANIAQTDANGNPTTPIDATATIDPLPATFSLGVNDISGGGSALNLSGSDAIASLDLAVNGLTLLPGADNVQVGMDNVPTSLTVDLPTSGPLATISASAPIGQLRIAAGDGSETLPADTLSGTDDDELDFTDLPNQFVIGARLTGVQDASVSLDPISINLTQDPTQSRPIDIDGQFANSDGTTATVTGTPAISQPSASTGISLNDTSGQPTTLNFTNAAPLAAVNLTIANLGSIPSAKVTLTNIPTSLSVCLDSGPSCERANPTELGGTDTESPAKNGNSAGNNRPYPANVSLDFDDNGSSGTSSNIASMTTLNASITPSAGASPISITNLRFHNLELDLGLPGTDFSYLGQSVPYLYMFIDSRNDPFVMNGITYPPTVQNFEIGSDSQPASATDRILWLQGEKCKTSVFGKCILYELQQASAGSLNCGNESVLEADDINLLDAFGLGIDLLDVCSSGGS